MTTTPEAYKLLSIPNAGLSNGEFSESGTLDLECVSVPIPPSYSASKEKDESGPGGLDHQVYLVLRLNALEVALDPQRTARRVDQGGFRQYVMEGTINDPSQLVVSFALSSSMAPGVEEDMETFEGILAGYVVSFQSPQTLAADSKAPPTTTMTRDLPQTTDTSQDLRGQLVMMNEQTGEIVGQVSAPHMRIHEDPSMYAPGHLNDPIYIEIPDAALTTTESDANAFETFAVLVPPDQQNWMTKGASLIGHAIEMGTSLLVTTVEAAAGYYVKNSKPSLHHPASGASTPVPGSVSEKGPGGPGLGGPPPPLPPRPKALVFLTSPRTRANLQKAHGVSAEAVKISSKTINLIDSMIRRAMGANPKRQKYFAREEGEARISTPASLGLTPGPALPPRSTSPSLFGFGFGSGKEKEKSAAMGGAGGPPLPPRSPSPLPPRSSTLPTSFPVPQHYPSPGPQGQFQAHPEGLAASPHPTQQPKLTTKARILISLDLLWSVTDASTRRILDTGTTELGRVVGHKYGDEAKESSLLMAGTARNVGLVYIDMTGIGRRAILKRAGKTYIKKQLASRPVPPVPSATPKQ